MEDWPRGDILTLIGILIGTVAAFAGIMALASRFQKLMLSALMMTVIVSSVCITVLWSVQQKKRPSVFTNVVVTGHFQPLVHADTTPKQEPLNLFPTSAPKEGAPAAITTPPPEHSVSTPLDANRQAEMEAVRRGLVGQWSIDWDMDIEFTGDGRMLCVLGRFDYRVVDYNRLEISRGPGKNFTYEMELKGDSLFIRWIPDRPSSKFTRVK